MISKARIACCNSSDGSPGHYRSQEELTLEQRTEDNFFTFRIVYCSVEFCGCCV